MSKNAERWWIAVFFAFGAALSGSVACGLVRLAIIEPWFGMSLLAFLALVCIMRFILWLHDRREKARG